MLIEEGALERQNGGWVSTERLAGVSIPDSVHGVIAARIDRLEAASRDALRRCSVIGRSFWPAAVEVDEGVIGALVRSGLVSDSVDSSMAGLREFAFKHALTRDVVYGTLPRPERRELHRRVGEWIQEVAPDRSAETVELAAYHYGQAVAYGEDDPAVSRRAFELLLAASEAAYGRGAFEAARRQLERALELAVDESRPAQAELGLDTVDGLLSPDDAELRSDALGLRSRVCWLSGRWDEALSSANAAVAALAGLPESRQLARALARLSQIEMLKQRHESVAHSREGIAVARRVGDSFAEWNATINLFTQEAAEGIAPDPDQISSIVQSAAEAGEFEEGYRAIINFIWAASGYLPVDRIELVVADARRRLADVPAPGSIGPYLEVSAAMCLLVPSARWTEADPVLREFEGREELAVSTRLAHLATAGGLAFRRGDVQQTNQLLEKLRPLALASGELQRIIPMAAVVLPWLARSGELDELRVLTDELLTVVDRQWPAVLDSVPVVRALADAGETELLARTAESIRETPDLSAHTQTALLAAEGLLALQRGNVGEAIEQLELAADRKRQLGRSYDAACLELDLAQALEADGQTEASKEVRASAAAVLEPLRCVNPF